MTRTTPTHVRMRTRLRNLLAMPFRRDTWQHVSYALFVPLVACPVLVLRPVLKSSRDGGNPGLGLLTLLSGLVAAAVAGPAFERLRLRLFFGERVAPRRSERASGAVRLFFVSCVLATLSCAVSIGWVIVSARNLTYPIWGWEPYPASAWGGPSPAGAVALHFFSGVVAFFVLPGVVVRLTEWQRAAVRRFAAE